MAYALPDVELIGEEKLIYDSGWVFTMDGQIGAEWNFTPSASVGVQAGAGYDTKPSHIPEVMAFDVTGGPSSKGGDRLYIPVSLFAKVQF